jgi:hypothetical protein
MSPAVKEETAIERAVRFLFEHREDLKVIRGPLSTSNSKDIGGVRI